MSPATCGTSQSMLIREAEYCPQTLQFPICFGSVDPHPETQWGFKSVLEALWNTVILGMTIGDSQRPWY